MAGQVLSPLVLLAALAVGVPPQPHPQASAQTLAEAIQKKYDAVRDFSADFVHIYEGGVLRKRAKERGSVLIKKPGKMRWHYQEPEEKLFVSDGVKMYSYLPEDRQVIISDVPPRDEATTPALFLAGKGNLLRDFTIDPIDVPGAPRGARALRLVPRRIDGEYAWLTLVVDEALRITMLVTADAQGGQSTFLFANFKENRGLSDKDFTFTIPRGVEVITDARPTP